ncbi:MmcQ/YjbR family DNA-binding protein [Luethyella okanaganae]|uniref:MmcQ/YjbR family DNA-binding protein n=1 Tax=Luethyella okanaganae TaxID=69372 RepID=A0ABW1VHS7_9MICO
MEHPKLFVPGDPLVQRLREVCLALPEAVEVEAWGRPTFRAGKPIFVHTGSSMNRPYSIVFKTDTEEHRALEQDPRFFHPPYYDRAHWLAIDFDGPDVDWQELAELIETSYRQVALKRQLALLELARPR